MRIPEGRPRRVLTVVGLIAAGAALFAAGAVFRGDGGERRVAVPGPERTVVVEREVNRSPDDAIVVPGEARPLPTANSATPPVTRKDGTVVEPVRERDDDTPSNRSTDPEPPVGDFRTEQATADELVRAWSAGDRAAARRVATQDVVDLLFRQTWSENNRFLGSRRDVSGMVVCSYAEGTGTLGLYVAATDGGFEVVGIEHTDPE